MPPISFCRLTGCIGTRCSGVIFGRLYLNPDFSEDYPKSIVMVTVTSHMQIIVFSLSLLTICVLTTLLKLTLRQITLLCITSYQGRQLS